jgi:hypothetical protein
MALLAHRNPPELERRAADLNIPDLYRQVLLRYR